MKKDKDTKSCGCGIKGGVKGSLKYCGADLPCTGIKKGDDYSTVLNKIDAAICDDEASSCSLNVSIEFNTETVTATSSVSGGTSPYTYEWKYPQNIFRGGFGISNNTTANITLTVTDPCDYGEFSGCVIVSGDGGGILQPSFYVPIYLTLKVKDVNGCIGYSSYMAYVPFNL